MTGVMVGFVNSFRMSFNWLSRFRQLMSGLDRQGSEGKTRRLVTSPASAPGAGGELSLDEAAAAVCLDASADASRVAVLSVPVQPAATTPSSTATMTVPPCRVTSSPSTWTHDNLTVSAKSVELGFKKVQSSQPSGSGRFFHPFSASAQAADFGSEELA
jgi:hypothetical protein